MVARRQKSFVRSFVLIVMLLGGLLGVKPVGASSSAIPQVVISTPSYPVGINSGENKLVTYSLAESGNVSGTITSRTLRFYTQYDVPLSDFMGPYFTSIKVNALQTNKWEESVYLPKSVVEQARSRKEYAIVLKTTFTGRSSDGATFDTQAALLLLLSPAEFGKVSPANGAVGQPVNSSLHWNGSVGAIDYEYCFDTVDNNLCDADWLGTYDINVSLPTLPLGTTFYWQVRANNTAGTTYADAGNWWSFKTCTAGPIVVTNSNESGAGSLRQAIAEICPGGTITFDSALSGQMIALTSTLAIDKDLTIDGNALLVPINISGSHSVGVFKVVPGVAVTMNKLTITDGNWVWGGGISNEGTLTLNKSTVSGNVSTEGGGISNSGNLIVLDSYILGNSADDVGGGIFNNSGTVTITNTELSGNMASLGGGIFTRQGEVTVTKGIFGNNSASIMGGAIYNFGALTVSDSSFLKNSASTYGGGIYHSYLETATVTGSTFFGNSAESGGGIYNDVSTLEITNSTLAGNTANFGGGIYNGSNIVSSAVLNLTNSTLSDNSATTYGSGIYNIGTLNYTNTIVANSMIGVDCYNNNGYSGKVVTNVNNLVETNGPEGHTCGLPAVTGDPLLGALADNGGVTQTMALLAGSPAINAGDAAACPATDQRGTSRPQGSACDIGAFEYVAPDHSINPLYLSLTGGKVIGGVPSADEDVLRFDGTNWNMYFDGSDVGTSSSDLFTFSIVDADTILVSFNTAITVNGIEATPRDVLRFDATSFGSTTAGTFSLYFDGSDVGLSSSSETIDAVSLLPDGRLLLSTTGNPSVPGLSGARDEDVLAFTPTSLGNATSGTWSLYFDGSDVGLGESSNEDVDALDVVGANIYLSTLGNFTVSGLAGADEDVFVCEATSIGSVTACTYSPDLYFDGSTWGLAGNDVDAFHFVPIEDIP